MRYKGDCCMVKQALSKIFAPRMIPLWLYLVFVALLPSTSFYPKYYVWFIWASMSICFLLCAIQAYRQKYKYSKYMAAVFVAMIFWLSFQFLPSAYDVYALIPLAFFLYLSIELAIKEWKAKEFGVARLVCILSAFLLYQMYQIATLFVIK